MQSRSRETRSRNICREYNGYTGYDYVPSDDPANAVAVEDVDGGSSAVDSEEACAEACDAATGCNAASYYGLMPEADWPAKKNCWLKTIATPCELPADAEDKPLAMLLMKVTGEDCVFLVPHSSFLIP